MLKNHFISGEYNLMCDVCYKRIKSHQAFERWDGLIVCSDDMEQRHEQDFVRPRQDKIAIPFSRPVPPLVFVNDSQVSELDTINETTLNSSGLN